MRVFRAIGLDDLGGRVCLQGCPGFYIVVVGFSGKFM